MLSRRRLAALIDKENSAITRGIFLSVPHATHLTGEDEVLDVDYYLRHRIETIKRIRLTAKTDALALAQMVDVDYDSARSWSRYLAEELDHDRLYLADLLHHGYSAARVDATPPLPATTRLLAFLNDQLREVGPLAAVSYSIFVEWNSQRGSAAVVAKAEKQFSIDHAKGSRTHIGIDDHEDHYEVMLDVAHRLVAKVADEQVLILLLRSIGSYFGDYFRELYDCTIAARKQPGRKSEPAAVHC